MPDIKASDLMDAAMEKAARRALKDWTEHEIESAVRETARAEASKWVANNRSLIAAYVETEMKAVLPKLTKQIARSIRIDLY